MTTVPIEELEANLRDLMARVESGETIQVVRDGEPVAELSPCRPDWRKTLGVIPATRHMRDIHIEPILLSPGIDAVALLVEDRGDGDLLP